MEIGNQISVITRNILVRFLSREMGLYIKKLLYLLFLLLFISCQNRISEKELNIAIATGYPPFTYTENDSLIGLEPDLINILSKQLKIPIQTTSATFTQLLSTFQEEGYHLAIGGITITDNRREIFDFSIPYYDATQTILTRNDVIISIDSLTAISGQKIGVLNNSTSLLLMENLIMKESSFTISNLKRYSSLDTLLKGLKDKEVTFIFLEGTIATIIEKNHEIKFVYKDKNIEKYAFIVKKDSKLLTPINNALAYIFETEEWETTLSKWLITN